jgi:GWxTD domain-containing protein
VLTKTLLAVGVFVTFCAIVPPLGAEGFPAAGRGDIEFQADCASFRRPSGTVVEEFYIKVRSEQLNFERKGKKTEARVLLAIAFINELGDAYETKSQEFTLSLEDKPARDDSHLLMVSYPITSAAKKVLITLEDLRARRRGILYMFTKERKKGTAEANIEVSEPLPGTLSLSDVQFAWSIGSRESEGSGPFTKSGLDVIPNPSRIYGLRKAMLFAYFEVYDQTEFALGRSRVFYEVATSVLNFDREVALSDTQKVVSSSDEWVQRVALDISTLPAGTYWLRTEVWQEEGRSRVLRERQFSVLWYDASWQKGDQDVLDEASLFLDNEQLKAFKRMKLGERERFLEEFWNGLDPTSGTARNEIREEFFRRVAYANAHFSFFQKGMLSDRGRIYVRYGEPDLIERQVVPTTGDAADIVVDEIVGRKNIEPRVRQKLGGRDKRSYEVWIYNMKGKPLFETQDQMMSPTLGMKFVFVDDMGVGNYILEYSSDNSKYR